MLIIEANQVHKNYLKDLFRHRELFYFFAWRDILVRYKQAVFGVLWAVIRPLLNMATFTFLFGKIANLPSENINYSLFVLAALIPWQLFANSTSEGCLILLNNSQLISKVYFPRIILPSAQVIVHGLDFMISLGVLIVLAIAAGSLDFYSFMFLPFAVAHVLILTLGSSFWLSALTAKYRDVRFLIPFFVQFGLFISPVGYGSFIIQGTWKWVYYLNPMVGIIDSFRWVFFGVTHPDFWFTLSTSILFTLLILISGFFYFRNVERTIADTI